MRRCAVNDIENRIMDKLDVIDSKLSGAVERLAVVETTQKACQRNRTIRAGLITTAISSVTAFVVLLVDKASK